MTDIQDELVQVLISLESESYTRDQMLGFKTLAEARGAYKIFSKTAQMIEDFIEFEPRSRIGHVEKTNIWGEKVRQYQPI